MVETLLMSHTLLPALYLLLAACAALGIAREQRIRKRLRRAAHASLCDRRFSTADGDVPGGQLRIVKTTLKSFNRLSGDTFESQIFYYCVAPGPSYVLAIARSRSCGRHIDVTWVIRPLSEARMQGALVGDRAATARTFAATSFKPPSPPGGTRLDAGGDFP